LGWETSYHPPMDPSSGYEKIAQEFLTRRGRVPSTGIGVNEVRNWARNLPPKSSVIDLGCGPGFPITSILIEEDLDVFAVDGAPAFVEAFRRNLPGVPVLCEAVQDSSMFDRTFDAALAWGLIFLLNVEDQHRLIQKFSEILAPGGRLLFTAPAPPATWIDVMTNLESISLGAEKYRELLNHVGLTVSAEYEDEGQNHYFDAFKNPSDKPQTLVSRRVPHPSSAWVGTKQLA
jgi:SAM-dependent methyltransferase